MTDTVISMDSPTSKDDNFSLQQQTTNAEDVTETTLARMTHLAKQQENQFALLRNRPLPPAPISTKGNSNTMGKLRRRRHHASDEELCCNILPGLVTFLALAGFVVGALIVVPYIFYTTPFWIAFHDALAICELYMVLANYFKCMRTPPGSVQSDWVCVLYNFVTIFVGQGSGKRHRLANLGTKQAWQTTFLSHLQRLQATTCASLVL